MGIWEMLSKGIPEGIPMVFVDLFGEGGPRVFGDDCIRSRYHKATLVWYVQVILEYNHKGIVKSFQTVF